MTKVTIDETTYSVTVAEENVNVTVADATETLNIQIASAASDSQVLSGGAGTSLVASSTGGLTTMKSVIGGDNVSLSDDGSTITISATEDDLSNNTTDNLAEGTTNLYYTDARVQTKLADVSGHIIPDTDNAYDLGSTTHKWRSMYLSGGSLYIDGHKIIGSDVAGDIDLTTDPNQNLNVQAGGAITMLSSGNTTTLQDNTVNLGPANNTGTTNVRGTLDVAVKIEMGDLDIINGQIYQNSQNGDLTLKTNGTGKVITDTSNLVVGTLDGANTQITPTGITGDVTGTVSSIANHDTDALSEGSTNLYHTTARVQSVIDTNTAGFITDYTVTESDVTQHQSALSITQSQISDLSHFSGDYNDLTNTPTIPTNNNQLTNGAGYITDYTVTESDVTQHQAALSITESQISDLTHYSDSDARSAVSLTTSNANELSYDSNTGVFTYVSPSTVAATGQVVFDVRNASGVDIARGDAVYIAGHSGNKVLVAKADANATGQHPSFGLANSAMLNNSDGTVLTHGEMLNVDTSSFSVGDTLYLSETAGELTATRPSSSATAVQNIGKVARSDSNNGIIVVAGSGRENDVPNLDSGHVFIGNGSGYDKRALTTADVSEGANLYYTDARVQSVIDTNSAGFITTYDPTEADITEHQAALSITESQISDLQSYITDYTVTQGDVTAHQAALSITESQISDLQSYITDYTVTQSDVTQHQAALSITESQISDLSHYTNAQAISAVEGEATLNLTGDVTIAQDLDVTGLVKINDGFTLGSFNPYAGSGLPATAMSTSLMGVGQEEGWAGMTVRSRGEHAWGLTGFGIPNEPPRALIAMQAGRLDGSSDDYLNDADVFGNLMFNPYSGYKTGTEWLTPSAEIRAIATEDHSSSGMGTKLEISTTENTNSAGATDASHTNATVTIQGTTISSSGTLIFDDAVEITEDLTVGASGKTTELGPYALTSGYNVNGLQIDAGDTSWAIASFKEYEGGANKPINAFTNPGLSTEVFGGTPSSPAALSSGKRVFAMTGTGSNDTSGNAPGTANIRFLGVTTEQQSSTNRGAQVEIHSTDNGNLNSEISLRIQGNQVIIGDGGDGILGSHSGNLVLDDNVIITGTISNNQGSVQINDNLEVTGNAEFDGNVTLGNANTDVVTSTGKLKASNGFNFTVLDTATANYLGSVLQIVETGDAAYISDGDSGSPCIGVWSGSSWKRIALGSDISST
jgi:hypothetical protein